MTMTTAAADTAAVPADETSNRPRRSTTAPAGLESALDGEITDHLGYDKHDPAGANRGNSRNGARAKTVLTDVGPVEVAVPRDRQGSFEPQIVRKRQRRL